MSRIRAGWIAPIVLALAGCAGGAVPLSDTPPPPATLETMSGRWILAAPNAPTCGMTFSGAPAAREGRVVPDGGCPENFYASRRWTLQDGILTIVDHESAALATLRTAGGRFQGKSAAETPLTLSP